MAKPIRLGIWGCKHGIDGHGVIVHRIPKATLVALCDLSKRTLAKAAAQVTSKPKRYRDPLLMFPHIDAVIIATRDIDHIDHMRLAIEHNLHVLIEKPIAVTEAQMEEFCNLLDLARSKGLIVTSCHPRRFDPPFLWFKRNLPKFVGELGPVTELHYDFAYHKPRAGWKQLTRSLLLDHHGHEIDLVNFLLGHTHLTEQFHDDSADRYLVTGIREDGIKFSFIGTRRMEERVYHEWMTIRFPNGSVTVNTSTGIATIKNNQEGTVKKRRCGKTDYAVRSLGVTRNFIDTITGKGTNYLTIRDMILNNLSGIRLLSEGSYTYKP